MVSSLMVDFLMQCNVSGWVTGQWVMVSDFGDSYQLSHLLSLQACCLFTNPNNLDFDCRFHMVTICEGRRSEKDSAINSFIQETVGQIRLNLAKLLSWLS